MWGLEIWGASVGSPLHDDAAAYLTIRAAGAPAYTLLLACQVLLDQQNASSISIPSANDSLIGSLSIDFLWYKDMNALHSLEVKLQ